jgi:hypothetical protein
MVNCLGSVGLVVDGCLPNFVGHWDCFLFLWEIRLVLYDYFGTGSSDSKVNWNSLR